MAAGKSPCRNPMLPMLSETNAIPATSSVFWCKRERFLIALERLTVFGVRVADGRHAGERGGHARIVLPLALQREPLLVGGQRLGKTALEVEGVGDVLQRLAFLLLEPAAPRHQDDQFVDAPRLVVVLAHRGSAGGPPERADHLLAGEVGSDASSASRAASSGASSSEAARSSAAGPSLSSFQSPPVFS